MMARDIVAAYGRLLAGRFNAPLKMCPWLEIRESAFSDRPRERWESRALARIPVADICISAPALADAVWGEGAAARLRDRCERRAWSLKAFLSGIDMMFPEAADILSRNGLLGRTITDSSEACVFERMIRDAAAVSGCEHIRAFAVEMEAYLDDAGGLSHDCPLLIAMDIDPAKNVFCFTISCLSEIGGNVPIWNWTADGAWVGSMDIGWEIGCFAREFLANPRPLKQGWRVIG